MAATLALVLLLAAAPAASASGTAASHGVVHGDGLRRLGGRVRASARGGVAAARGEAQAAHGSLLSCGTTSATSLPELQHAFEFAHGVCCDQLGENCGPSAIGLPTTCTSSICARAVALVNASCAALLVSPAFPVGIGFQPLLDNATVACADAAAAETEDEPVRHVIAGHGQSAPLSLVAQGGGLLTDGMGAGGHIGLSQDWATVQAGASQVAQLDLRTLWLDKDNYLRVFVDEGEPTVLAGMALPPVAGGGRRFRSKPGGKIQLLLVKSVVASLSFFSLSIEAACVDASGCGGHGTCSGGNCTCSGGYNGMGCQCAVGYKPAGSVAPCKEDPCWDKAKSQPKVCSGHGSCVSKSGACNCEDGYVGDNCAQPEGCASEPCGPHGTCTGHGAQYSCACESGCGGDGRCRYHGRNCSEALPCCTECVTWCCGGGCSDPNCPNCACSCNKGPSSTCWSGC